MTIELIAPAKLNLALEVLSRRVDGYHEIVSLMQTIDLADRVRLSEAPDIELHVSGDQTLNVPLEGPRNLAYRAAVALREAGGSMALGCKIELDKGIPAGTGLGGGSSDAAAVLRGLNQLWQLNLGSDALMEVGAEVGSDVPFFLLGGAALVRGRGEKVEALPDGPLCEFTVFTSPVEIEDKTRRMYSLLTPADFTSGHKAEVASQTLSRGLPLAETDYVNIFDRHIAQVVPPLGRAFKFCRDSGLAVLTTGSGPGFFAPLSLSEIPHAVLNRLEEEYDVTALPCRSLSRSQATATTQR